MNVPDVLLNYIINKYFDKYYVLKSDTFLRPFRPPEPGYI
jgi:hypothetical protein